jgi:hypothetical protein
MDVYSTISVINWKGSIGDGVYLIENGFDDFFLCIH